MKKRVLFLSEQQKKEYLGGAKARKDIDLILKQLGYKEIICRHCAKPRRQGAGACRQMRRAGGGPGAEAAGRIDRRCGQKNTGPVGTAGWLTCGMPRGGACRQKRRAVLQNRTPFFAPAQQRAAQSCLPLFFRNAK